MPCHVITDKSMIQKTASYSWIPLLISGVQNLEQEFSKLYNPSWMTDQDVKFSNKYSWGTDWGSVLRTVQFVVWKMLIMATVIRPQLRAPYIVLV